MSHTMGGMSTCHSPRARQQLAAAAGLKGPHVKTHVNEDLHLLKGAPGNAG